MAKQTDEKVVAFDDLGFAITVKGPLAAHADAVAVAGATSGWKPQIVLDGEILPFSRDNALALYLRKPAILQKIRDGVK